MPWEARVLTEERITELVATWQQRLRLGHYDLRVCFNLPTEKDSDAEIRIHDYYDQGTVRINGKEFQHWTDAYANSVIVHELVHIFEKKVRLTADAACEALSSQATEVFWAWYLVASEQMVENLARAFLVAYGCKIPLADEADQPEESK